MTDDPHILWLDQEGAPGNPLLGGKFASLAEMTAAGFAVPPGFGVTTTAYRVFMAHAGLDDRAAFVREAARRAALAEIGSARARLVEAIGAAPMPDKLETAIRRNYAILEERTGRAGVPVAVRSSGEAEDLADASFAGQYDTYLWIAGADAVLRHVRACWASMFGDAALSYRRAAATRRPEGGDGICVGIQQMVEARAAGVMFTLDPLNGDRSKIVMEACWGLGEGVVKGDVTPSRFTVDKVTLEIVKRDIVPQVEEYRFDPAAGAVRLMPLAPERGTPPASTTPRRSRWRRSPSGSRGIAARRRTSSGPSAQTAKCGCSRSGPRRCGASGERRPRLREQERGRARARRLSGGRVAAAGPGQREP